MTSVRLRVTYAVTVGVTRPNLFVVSTQGLLRGCKLVPHHRPMESHNPNA